jgi:hypothetical protein
MRHDKVGAHLHYSICKALGIEMTNGTHREFTANMPDIIIRNKKEKTCILIDVAIPADRNIMQKNLEAIPGKHSIDSLQETAILGTSHIIRKVLQSET